MRIRFAPIALLGLAALVALPARGADDAKTKKIILIAGRPSHGPGDHEYNAGAKLLQKCLTNVPGADPVFVPGGWPDDEHVFDGAASVVLYMDGGGGHPIIKGDHLKTIQKLIDKGVGFACMHYAVEVPKGEPGDKFLDWLGGYYETGYSTNPHWVADIKEFPEHPITRGVKPFSIRDEWYFNLRFRPEMKGITPIIVAKPDDETRKGVSSSPRGPYKHIVEAQGRDEVLSWAIERPDGGRSFGLTGGHAHKNWGNDDFRKLVLNAIVWTAKLDVPSQGIDCGVTDDDLTKNLDPKGKK
ncbi:MAG: ThuA domain-containing protein [Isosphaeraceae bacterium]